MTGSRAPLSRRTVLAWAAAGAGALALPGTGLAQGAGRPVGLQLFTVRDRMMADLPGALSRIAEIGYREVEFAGYFGAPPAEIRRLVAASGLSAPAAHIGAFTGPDAVRDDPDRWIGEVAEAGHEWLVIPWLDEEDRRTLDQYRELADALNGFAERCRASGLKFAYHNHDFEFRPIDGVQPYDLLMERCDPALVAFELDLYWATHAGRDPRALLAQYPGRFPMCHVKDRAADGSMIDVGAGTIDFAAIFADPNASFVHYFVEHDAPRDSLATAAANFAPAREAIAARR